ncbi:hypothetical protein LAZ67_6002575 [Cordylochernes scorpioides]|uniref:Retrovirus-related Pol polyprotein from transposon TNT 1-94-like beta-barrel domain-containing protein n=1 Tax=Cordylochernes scorpioides TaxID=51811 RepID=A0ABY6KL91_9ARAC|nr:hypothetical protein LAZ67_6002575 [Cordylochernes scorpioides]
MEIWHILYSLDSYDGIIIINGPVNTTRERTIRKEDTSKEVLQVTSIKITAEPTAEENATDKKLDNILAAINLTSALNSWLLDSGATNQFVDLHEVSFDPIMTASGTNKAKGCGHMFLKTSIHNANVEIKLNNVLYVPHVRRNLLSVSKIEANGYSTQTREYRLWCRESQKLSDERKPARFDESKLTRVDFKILEPETTDDNEIEIENELPSILDLVKVEGTLKQPFTFEISSEIYMEEMKGERGSREVCGPEKGKVQRDFIFVRAFSGRGTLPLWQVPENVKLIAKYYVKKALQHLLEHHVPGLYGEHKNKVFVYHYATTMIASLPHTPKSWRKNWNLPGIFHK